MHTLESTVPQSGINMVDAYDPRRCWGLQCSSFLLEICLPTLCYLVVTPESLPHCLTTVLLILSICSSTPLSTQILFWIPLSCSQDPILPQRIKLLFFFIEDIQKTLTAVSKTGKLKPSWVMVPLWNKCSTIYSGSLEGSMRLMDQRRMFV